MLMLDGNRITDLSNCTLKGLISEISLKANNLSTVNANLFFNVHGLNSIDFNTNNLKSIPAGLLRNQYELSSVSISDNLLENLQAGLFQNLTFLENVDFSANLLTEIPAGIFQSLQNLNTVNLSGNLLTGIPAGLFQSLQNLNTVDLSDNSLIEIPAGLFQSLHNLKTVDLSANLLTGIPTGLFQSLKNLYTVDLCDNSLTDIPAGLFQSLHNLNTVDLSSNFLTSIISRMFINLPTLIKINLVANQLNYIADDAISPYLDSLKYIDLSQNNFTTIPTIFQYYNVFLNENNIVCDCKLNSNYEHMHSNRNQNTTRTIPDYNKNNFTCEKPDNLHGKLLYDLKPSDLFCLENFPPCPECCTCFRRTMDEGVTVDCKQVNMFALPTQLPEGSIELDLSGNLITKLDTPYPYLAKLEKLNLQNNLIDLVSADVLDILDQGHMRKLQLNKNRLNVLPQKEDVFRGTNLSDLKLGNNPWKCNCHTSWMKQWLIVRRNIIQDMDMVKCATGIPAGQVSTQFIEYQFNCTAPAAIVVRNELLYVGVVLVFFVFVIILIYVYRGQIKILLYVHCNWHPFDAAENADISHMTYDAFISYSGLDYKWVCFDLLPKLENHNPPYKVCVHDRDFMPGAYIEDNIMEAVQSSRRMIMVLSHNYLKSEWCMLEFRAAHNKVLNDCTNYLILVLYDDVNVSELDEDMKLYIRTNTYLARSNQWFYDRLLYSMPTKNLQQLRKEMEAKLGKIPIND